MSDAEPPRIEFPCDWSLRIIGERVDDFEAQVRDVLERHCDDLRDVRERLSREGRYVSLSCVITATGEQQLRALHDDLLATGIVRLVL